MRKIFMILVIVNLRVMTKTKDDDDCIPPKPCKFGLVHEIIDLWASQVFSTNDLLALVCPLTAAASSRIENSTSRSNQSTSGCRKKQFYLFVDIIMPRSPGPNLHQTMTMLTRETNLQGIIDFMAEFYPVMTIKFVNVKRISSDLNVHTPSSKNLIFYLYFINVHFDFYQNENENKNKNGGGRLIKSCNDLNHSQVINSVFQINKSSGSGGDLNLLNCHFRTPMCPSMFRNSRHTFFVLSGLQNTFMRQNILKFTTTTNNSQDDLNSTIEYVRIFRHDNIVLDASLLDPRVFKSTREIFLNDGVARISDQFLAHYRDLRVLSLDASVFQRLVHSQGIEWMHTRNAQLPSVNMSDRAEIREHASNMLAVSVRFRAGREIRDALPDRDLCLYESFPFERMIYVRLEFDVRDGSRASIDFNEIDASRWSRRTCTLELLAKHFGVMNQALATNNPWSAQDLSDLLNSSNRVCDYEAEMKRLCVKRRRPTVEWTVYDWARFNKCAQLVCDTLVLVVSLLGIVTNSLVVLVIVRKENRDLFKGFKQYTYLSSISVFSISILCIQIVSWLSDCKETISIFCPETRRFIPVQFFKIIFKETSIPALRFASNFAYVAFAFNRISLIGKDHPKLVDFFSKIKSNRYILTTGLISIGLSVVKGFKYKINYDHSEREYPYTVEVDFYEKRSDANRVYFVINVVCDLLNYFVFVCVNLGIDVYMLVRLRRTLDEKLKRFATMMTSLDEKTTKTTTTIRMKQFDQTKSDMDNAKNNALRMVVFNSMANFFFKLPLVVMPLVNAVVVFQYGDYKSRGLSRPFQFFYELLSLTHSSALLADLADLLFTMLIACQLFFYRQFDTKMRQAFERLKKPNNS